MKDLRESLSSLMLKGLSRRQGECSPFLTSASCVCSPEHKLTEHTGSPVAKYVGRAVRAGVSLSEGV